MPADIYILLMVFSMGYKSGGMTLEASFGSYEACEVARAQTAKAHGKSEVLVVAQGCYPRTAAPKIEIPRSNSFNGATTK